MTVNLTLTSQSSYKTVEDEFWNSLSDEAKKMILEYANVGFYEYNHERDSLQDKTHDKLCNFLNFRGE